jgi:trans-aconitate 2-methyltransferase
LTGAHTWDPHDYERHSATQEGWARDCLARLRLRGDEQILDIGCGDGRVSAELSARVPSGAVVGVDSSAEMIAHARQRHLGASRPNLDFVVADATALAFTARFDLVVSFNCLHWVADQPAVLGGIARALTARGRLFLHFGGRGNVAAMRAVVEEVSARSPWCADLGDVTFPWCFPEASWYRSLMEAAGLLPLRVELLGAQMSHDGPRALAGWLRTTWLPYLDRLPPERRQTFVDEVVAAYLAARPADEQGRIWIDAVRLEAEGRRP